MLKFFLLILFLVGVYLLFFRKNQQKPTKNDFQSTQDSIMLECAECGTYVSSEEVIVKDGKYYCSKECAKLK
ncbi:PP0621 family protein [uncultured Helicobacter sp.]|uniref:PP0621 family protein n=1 Tax=uncultured Helicobacter sp. TaxID=175537 RepID=UPI00260678C0|nr:PP0621 family protein [uncultured Helicobacter sp.]